jgi:hypothetical protein
MYAFQVAIQVGYVSWLSFLDIPQWFVHWSELTQTQLHRTQAFGFCLAIKLNCCNQHTVLALPSNTSTLLPFFFSMVLVPLNLKRSAAHTMRRALLKYILPISGMVRYGKDIFYPVCPSITIGLCSIYYYLARVDDTRWLFLFCSALVGEMGCLCSQGTKEKHLQLFEPWAVW